MSPGHSEVAYNDSLCKFNFSYSKRVSRRFVQNRKYPKALCFQKGSGTYRSLDIIPTRCRNLYLEQFCLDDIVPTILIILIARIIIAIRWMLIKILSAVINHHGEHKVIVPAGCYLDINIICKPDSKSKMLFNIFLLPACSTHNNIPAAHVNNFQFCQRAESTFG